MKHVKHLLSSAQSKGYKRQQASPTKAHIKIMDLLWLRMTEIYGNQWVSGYGITPNRSWVEALARYEPEDIKRGLELTVRLADEFPPNLAMFISRCEKPRIEPCHNIARLPEPPKHKTISIGESALKKIWESGL